MGSMDRRVYENAGTVEVEVRAPRDGDESWADRAAASPESWVRIAGCDVETISEAVDAALRVALRRLRHSDLPASTLSVTVKRYRPGWPQQGYRTDMTLEFIRQANPTPGEFIGQAMERQRPNWPDTEIDGAYTALSSATRPGA